MYNQYNKNSDQDRKINQYFQKQQPEYENYEEQPVVEKPSSEIIMSWKAPEFEVYEKSARWYLIAIAIILAIVIYALVTNSPIMAITFILIGIVGYIHLQKDPRILDFAITPKGIVADKELYPFENIKSFWIFYDPPLRKVISLHTTASVFPHIHIPIHEENPVEIREILLQFIKEVKQDQSLVDTIEQLLHI